MRWRDLDLGAIFALLLAAALSVLTAGILFIHVAGMRYWTLLWIGTTAAAWVGLWAWLDGRWLLAAAAFFVATAWPGGFFVVLSAPISFALFIVSLIRAWIDRPAKKRNRRVAHDRAR